MNSVKIGLIVIGLLGTVNLISIIATSSFSDETENQTQLQHQQKLQQIKEKVKAEKESKLAAMSPEERSKFLRDEEEKKKKAEIAAAKIREEEQKRKEAEEKQEKFRKQQVAYAYVLKAAIKQSAFDPDSVIFREPKYYSNGVCVYANGKNRFGGYVGFKEYCALVDKKGKWKISQ